MWTLQGASVTSVTYLIPAQARSIIPALSRDCQMSNTSRATYYRQMFAGNSVQHNIGTKKKEDVIKQRIYTR